MKRVAKNSHQPRLVDEEAGFKFKSQSELQKFLELQKEFVSKKRKLQATNQKKEILLAEVRFLRRRQKYLLGLQFSQPEPQQDLFQPQDSYMRDKMVATDIIYGANEVVLKKSSPTVDLDPIVDEEGNRRGKDKVVLEPLRVNKKPKNCRINGKKIEKKFLWQDQVTMK